MKKLLLLAALIIGFGMMAPAKSEARVFVGVNVGGGYGYGGGYYRGYYPGYYDGYYPGYYIAPPPVVYAAPPPVYYAPPVAPPVVYQQAPGYAVPNSVMANQASETYTDDQGQTCREYQTTAKIAGSNHAPAYGIACLQPDGTWHIVK